MIEPMIRILLRYAAIPFLLWLGLPEDSAKTLIQDPDIQMMLMVLLPVIAGGIEGWWLWARRKGRAL